MLSQLFVFRQSQNFTSDNGVRVPPTIPINHYFGSKNQQNRTRSPILLFHAEVFKPKLTCHEHSILFTVMHVDNQIQLDLINYKREVLVHKLVQVTPRSSRSSRNLHSTTSFLTATTLVYAIGAGITAAAGTRLALQWILEKGCKLSSFRCADSNEPTIVISCRYLPESGLGNLRACCLPWMWQPFLRLPLRNRTLILRHPSTPWQATTLPSKVDRAEI